MTDGLTEKQAGLVSAVLQGYNITQASELAGYSGRAGAHLGISTPQAIEAISAGLRRQLAMDAVASRLLLRKVVDEDKWPIKVRVEAAKTLLDRAGFIAPKAPDAPGAEKPLQQMDQSELQDRLTRLQNELANRAPVIEGSAVQDANEAQDVDLLG